MMAAITVFASLCALASGALLAWRWWLMERQMNAERQRAHELALHSKRVEWDEAEIASQKMMLKRIDERVRQLELRGR